MGAYTTALLTTKSGWTAWEALPVAILVAMIAGVTLGAPTLRLRGDYLAIVTLGFGEIVRIVAQNSTALGTGPGHHRHPAPRPILRGRFPAAPAAVLLPGAGGDRSDDSHVGAPQPIARSGRAWSAIREDEDAAEAMGVHTFTMKLWAFAVGASTGGLAGWIYASKVSFINPDNFPFFFSVIILAAVVLGGMGSLPGVIAGAVAIGYIPEYLRDVAAGEWITRQLNTLIGGHAGTITEYRVLLFGAALVAIMVFRPQGLIPSRQRAAELAEAGETTGMAAAVVVSHELEEPPAEATEEEVASSDSTGAEAGGAEAGEAELPIEIEAAQTVLELRDVTMAFGGVVAMKDVSLAVRRGQIFGIIGPNGAGKTTLFNCVTGIFPPSGGDILVNGKSIVGWRPHRVTEAGVARTFQNIRLFPNVTALENVLVGVDARHQTSVPGALLGLPRHRREERVGREEAERLLAYVGIAGAVGRPGPEPAVRRPAAPGDRPGDRHRPQRPVAGRAGRRHEPGGEARSHRPDPPDPRFRPDGRPHRARHAPRHGRVRPVGRARLRREDRRRGTGRRPDRPPRHRGLSGGTRCCLNWRTSTSTTARLRP